MHNHFATVRRRITVFATKCSTVNSCLSYNRYKICVWGLINS